MTSTLTTFNLPEGIELKDGQAEGIAHLLSGRSKLILDDVGFGKTVQGVVAFNELRANKVLILCESSVRYHWEKTIQLFATRPYTIQVYTKMHEWRTDAQVHIVTYDLLNSPMIYDQLKGLKWSCLLIDEIQKVKEAKAKRTKKVLGHWGLWRKAAYRWGFSATPMTTTPINLWPIANSLGKKVFKMDWMTFTRKFCQRFQGPWGWDVSGACNTKLLNKYLYETGLAIRRKRKKKAQLRFMTIDKGPVLWDDNLNKDKLTEKRSAAVEAKMRAMAGTEKIAPAIKYVQDVMYPDSKVVLFTWHREVTEGLYQGLKGDFKCVKHYGGMTLQHKESAKRKFMYGDTNIYIANMASAGTGMDGLQEVCSHAIFVEVPWNYTDIMQTLGRLDREGQEEAMVLGEILLIGNSVEEYVLDTVFKKEGLYHEVIG